MKGKWGKGIPAYQEEDLMTKQDLFDFAQEVVWENEVESKGYEVLAANNYLDKLPHMVLKKDNQIYFILVEAAIAPDQPALDPRRKANLLNQARKFDAICYYASVGFGSLDEVRFKASLALKGDGYYANYIGLQLVEGVNPEELITDPEKKLFYSYLNLFSKGYRSGDFSELFPHLDPDCVWHSQWVIEPRKGAEAIANYLTEKGESLQKSHSQVAGTIVELLGNVHMVENDTLTVNGTQVYGSFGLFYTPGKLCLFLEQEVDGETNALVLNIDINEQKKITVVNLNMPELYRFRPYIPEEINDMSVPTD